MVVLPRCTESSRSLSHLCDEFLVLFLTDFYTEMYSSLFSKNYLEKNFNLNKKSDINLRNVIVFLNQHLPTLPSVFIQDPLIICWLLPGHTSRTKPKQLPVIQIGELL